MATPSKNRKQRKAPPTTGMPLTTLEVTLDDGTRIKPGSVVYDPGMNASGIVTAILPGDVALILRDDGGCHSQALVNLHAPTAGSFLDAAAPEIFRAMTKAGELPKPGIVTNLTTGQASGVDAALSEDDKCTAIGEAEWIVAYASLVGVALDHPAQGAFNEFRKALNTDGDIYQSACNLLSHWRKFPDAMKAACLRGWQNCGDFPTRREMASMVDDSLTPTLDISCYDNNVTAAAQFSWRSPASVQVAITVGTPKAEALAKLRVALKVLESRWEECIALPATEDQHIRLSPYEAATGEVR